MGKGVLHIMKDIGLGEPSSGAVPLVSGEIAEDLANYFVKSEQIPSAVSLGVFVSADQMVTAAGGLLVQFHATLPEDLIAHIEHALAVVPAVTTMVRDGYIPQEMLEHIELQSRELDRPTAASHFVRGDIHDEVGAA